MNITWEHLIKTAQDATRGEHTVSPFVKGGYVGTAILTNMGNVYTGINLETRCHLGTCAERYALHKMFEANKDEYPTRMAVIYRDEVQTPCGACREMYMQYGNGAHDMEILLSLDPLKTIKLDDMMQPWWGQSRLDGDSRPAPF